jgi:enhancing lycopene biosynthesis protein 2
MNAVQGTQPSDVRVAVVLAGCGARDGSEITEAVSLLVALSQKGFHVDCFAPNRKMHHVVDHLSGREVVEESRHQLHEAARIARGRIHPLTEMKVQHFDAVVLAGGFGAAKNLCNYAFSGVDAHLEVDVKAALLPFLDAHKPLGALCIAPIVLALLCREAHFVGAQVTLGDGSAQEAVRAVESWGLRHVPVGRRDACIDRQFRMVTAPAYMFDDATPADVFACAVALVDGVQSLLDGHHSAT